MKIKKLKPNIKELEKFWASYKNEFQDIQSTEDCVLDALEDFEEFEKSISESGSMVDH